MIVSAGCSTEVGLVGLPITTRSALVGHERRVEDERLVEYEPVDRMPGRAQGGLRLGELRVHDQGVRRAQRPGEQDERLRRPRVSSTSASSRPWRVATARWAAVGSG